MSVAARISRIALGTALAAAVSLSAGGLATPRSVQAAASHPVQATTAPHKAAATRSSRTAPAPSRSRPSRSRTRQSQRARIVHIAESHIGAVYKFGAEGMKAFDCSGLVFRVFKQAGLASRISGVRRGAKGYYYWFRKRGRASRSNPRPGDLVIWHKGKHIGIYVGDGQVVSALNKKYGVRKTGIDFVSGFTTYLHVRLHGHVAPADGGTGQANTAVRTVAQRLVVRDGPGRNHDRVATVGRGTIIQIEDKALDAQDREWIKGKLPSGKLGWVPAWRVRPS